MEAGRLDSLIKLYRLDKDTVDKYGRKDRVYRLAGEKRCNMRIESGNPVVIQDALTYSYTASFWFRRYVDVGVYDLIVYSPNKENDTKSLQEVFLVDTVIYNRQEDRKEVKAHRIDWEAVKFKIDNGQ